MMESAKSTGRPFDQLERIFHEPKRLAIVSALCSAARGLTFTELREECELTDGNLSRHLKALADDRVVAISKRFVGVKPQTRVTLTATGRNRFLQYLDALEQVLQNASAALQKHDTTTVTPAGTKLAQA